MKRFTRSTQSVSLHPTQPFDPNLPSLETPCPVQQPQVRTASGLLSPTSEPKWVSCRPTLQPRSRKSVPDMHHPLHNSIWSDRSFSAQRDDKPTDLAIMDTYATPPSANQPHPDDAISHHIAGLLQGALTNGNPLQLSNCTFEIKVHVHGHPAATPGTQARGDDGLALKRKRFQGKQSESANTGSEEDDRLAKKLKLTHIGNEGTVAGKGRQSGRLLRMSARRKASKSYASLRTMARR